VVVDPERQHLRCLDAASLFPPRVVLSNLFISRPRCGLADTNASPQSSARHGTRRGMIVSLSIKAGF
jgi:hypothetical protein